MSIAACFQIAEQNLEAAELLLAEGYREIAAARADYVVFPSLKPCFCIGVYRFPVIQP